MSGHGEESDLRSDLVRLAARLIIEEGLEGEATAPWDENITGAVLRQAWGIASAEAYLTETWVVSSKRVVDGLNVSGSIPALPCVHKHDTASIALMLQVRRAATPAHS
jgi:hypothetical protein